MKKISEHLTEDNPDRLPGFKAAAQAAVKRILDTFDDWEFFMGESMGEGGMIALMNYREDGVTPFMLFFKDGVVEEKVVSGSLVCTVGTMTSSSFDFAR